jgi:protoporphyrinogen oxidase
VGVLGAGPAGISAAWRLSARGIPVTVLERDAAVGGMGKTITVGDYAVDYGPHTFHIRETEESRAIHEAIKPFFGEDPLILTRGTRVLLRGKEYVYPLEMLQVLIGVSPLLSFRIVFDYVIASLKSALAPPKKEHSFEEWGVRNLGRTLYDLCFGLYSARVWGRDVADFVEAGAARREAQRKNITCGRSASRRIPRPTTSTHPRKGISVLFRTWLPLRDSMAAAAAESPVVRPEREGDRSRG